MKHAGVRARNPFPKTRRQMPPPKSTAQDRHRRETLGIRRDPVEFHVAADYEAFIRTRRIVFPSMASDRRLEDSDFALETHTSDTVFIVGTI